MSKIAVKRAIQERLYRKRSRIKSKPTQPIPDPIPQPIVTPPDPKPEIDHHEQAVYGGDILFGLHMMNCFTETLRYCKYGTDATCPGNPGNKTIYDPGIC